MLVSLPCRATRLCCMCRRPLGCKSFEENSNGRIDPVAHWRPKPRGGSMAFGRVRQPLSEQRNIEYLAAARAELWLGILLPTLSGGIVTSIGYRNFMHASSA